MLVFWRRLRGDPGPWTNDPTLQSFYFTNCYRALDRTSQDLIACQEGWDREKVVVLTLLYKWFNNPDTWKELCKSDPKDLGDFEARAMNMYSRGERMFSAAYITPNFPGGGAKYRSIFRILEKMENTEPAEWNLRGFYEYLRGFPLMGPFLAMQYATDVGYALGFDEDFMVPGPGALRGVRKVSPDDPSHVIYTLTDWQEEMSAEAGSPFPALPGRRLAPIDVQNLFCEFDKWTRVAHRLGGRIKRRFHGQRPEWSYVFPRHWGDVGLDRPPTVPMLPEAGGPGSEAQGEETSR
jgi:hypothetical protein